MIHMSAVIQQIWTMISNSLFGSQQRRACSLYMELMDIVHVCNTAAFHPTCHNIEAGSRPHRGAQPFGRTVHRPVLLVSQVGVSVCHFVDALVVSAVRWVGVRVGGWLAPYPVFGKSREH